MWLSLSSVQGDGLTLREIISNIPHDGAAIFLYVLLAAFVGIPLWVSRRRDRTSAESEDRESGT